MRKNLLALSIVSLFSVAAFADTDNAKVVDKTATTPSAEKAKVPATGALQNTPAPSATIGKTLQADTTKKPRNAKVN